ncbi:hypothetical protein A9G11_04895 [Gilliamella sp. wkB108]|uniref:regulatory protein RecX n=1 Tax=Gilliamella sp. wkB108 TaxID=3120256 RepID=UPI00080DE5D3|nr:regulatory protein RecX [Gilliamella apicola]OCG23963.1 hypothetical protein A9G11_04895 [Gilliamella apicola]
MNQKLNKLILNKAVQLLAQRDHSSYELTQKITLFFSKKIKHCDDEFSEQLNQLKNEISDVIQYCISKNWVNDTQYIEKYIIMRADKGYGKYKIAIELKQRGISSHVSRDLLQKSAIDWVNIAHKQLIKKFKQVDPKDNQQRQKGIQYLISRGYTQDDVKTLYSLLT